MKYFEGLFIRSDRTLMKWLSIETVDETRNWTHDQDYRLTTVNKLLLYSKMNKG